MPEAFETRGAESRNDSCRRRMSFAEHGTDPEFAQRPDIARPPSSKSTKRRRQEKERGETGSLVLQGLTDLSYTLAASQR